MDSVPYLLFGYILLTSISTFVPYLLIIFYIYTTLSTGLRKRNNCFWQKWAKKILPIWKRWKQVSRLLYLLPPFVLCQEKLYFFKLTHIIEVPVTSITNVSAISKDKYNNITVLIEHSQRTTLTIPSELYPFLTAFMFKYRLATGYVAEGQRGIEENF